MEAVIPTPLALRSILAAIDLSESADAVLASAGALARRTGARLHVLHAYGAGGTVPAVPAAFGFQGRLYQARRDVQARIRRMVPEGVELGMVEVIYYDTVRAIRQMACSVDADLLVFGPHRRIPRADALIGSTAERVLRATGTPCLVVPAALTLPLSRVVVAAEGEAPAHASLDEALAWTAAFGPPGGAELRVARLGAPEVTSTLGASPSELRADAAPRLAAVREDALPGEAPAEAILRYAEQHAAELVVVAVPTKSPVQRLLKPSTTTSIARAAPCAVLLVPPAGAEPLRRVAQVAVSAGGR